MNERNLWKGRFHVFQKEIVRYGKYIFNNHLMLVLLFLIGGVGFYYQQWLETLSENFPAGLVTGIVFMFLLTGGSVITLLREADIVFLLPMEDRLGEYFQKAFLFSYLNQVYVLVIGYLLVLPMFHRVLAPSGTVMVFAFVLLLVGKFINMATVWQCTFQMQSAVRVQDVVIRLLLNFLFAFGIFNSTLWLLVVAILLIVGYFFFRYQEGKGKIIHWEYLIWKEQARMGLFYRIANMFVDVPHMKSTAKRRKWLDFLLTRISFGQKNTYQYLYWRTFLRSGDYFGIYLRLLVIGSVVAFVLPNVYAQGIAAVLFLYLIGFQLRTLENHHFYLLWTSIYPIGEIERKDAFHKLMWLLLLVAALVLAVVTLFGTRNILVALMVFLGGVAVAYLVTKGKK